METRKEEGREREREIPLLLLTNRPYVSKTPNHV